MFPNDFQSFFFKKEAPMFDLACGNKQLDKLLINLSFCFLLYPSKKIQNIFFKVLEDNERFLL